MYQEPVLEPIYDTVLLPSTNFVCSICSAPLTYPYFKCSCQNLSIKSSTKPPTYYHAPIVYYEEFNYTEESKSDLLVKNDRKQDDSIPNQFLDINFDFNQPLNAQNNAIASAPEEFISFGNNNSAKYFATVQDNNVIHYVTAADTLPGISLQYGVKVMDIRKANKLFGNNLAEYETLIIPGAAKNLAKIPDPKMLEAIRRSKLIRKFKYKFSCTEEEAKYYLEIANYNFDNAILEYNSDLRWEKSHPYSSDCLNQSVQYNKNRRVY